MLRYALLLATLFVGANSHASGKLIFQPRYDLEVKEVLPAFGLSIYEKIPSSPFALNSWIGYGESEFEFVDKVKYISAKNMLELPLFHYGLVIGAGYEATVLVPEELWHHSVLAKVAVKLW